MKNPVHPSSHPFRLCLSALSCLLAGVLAFILPGAATSTHPAAALQQSKSQLAPPQPPPQTTAQAPAVEVRKAKSDDLVPILAAELDLQNIITQCNQRFVVPASSKLAVLEKQACESAGARESEGWSWNDSNRDCERVKH